ncbi:MAG: DUF1315 family protein, partial [Pseudomonadota bacterium]
EVYRRLKQALELGKWPDGSLLAPEQKEQLMQAIIAWDQLHLGPEDRVGYVPPKKADVNGRDKPDLPTPLNWKDPS